jgi:hypothetical protein
VFWSLRRNRCVRGARVGVDWPLECDRARLGGTLALTRATRSGWQPRPELLRPLGITALPLLVRQPDYMEFASLVAAREVDREDSAVITAVSSEPVALTRAPCSPEPTGGAKAMDAMCNHIGEFISPAQLAAEAGMPISR